MRKLVGTITAAAVAVGAITTQPGLAAPWASARNTGVEKTAAGAAAAHGHRDIGHAVHELRQRIEDDHHLSGDERTLHHQTLNTIETETARIEAAEQRLAALVAEASQQPSESRKAEIEAEEQSLLSEIGGSRATLQDLAKIYEAKLTPHERAEAEVLIQKIRSGEMSVDDALGGGEDAGGWVVILVLYVLLVVVGAHG